jgi:hypothetical protein
LTIHFLQVQKEIKNRGDAQTDFFVESLLKDIDEKIFFWKRIIIKIVAFIFSFKVRCFEENVIVFPRLGTIPFDYDKKIDFLKDFIAKHNNLIINEIKAYLSKIKKENSKEKLKDIYKALENYFFNSKIFIKNLLDFISQPNFKNITTLNFLSEKIIAFIELYDIFAECEENIPDKGYIELFLKLLNSFCVFINELSEQIKDFTKEESSIWLNFQANLNKIIGIVSDKTEFKQIHNSLEKIKEELNKKSEYKSK